MKCEFNVFNLLLSLNGYPNKIRTDNNNYYFPKVITLVSSKCWGDSHMKGAGMLVVLHWGVNFGFWSHLGCSGENAFIFSRKDLF